MKYSDEELAKLHEEQLKEIRAMYYEAIVAALNAALEKEIVRLWSSEPSRSKAELV